MSEPVRVTSTFNRVMAVVLWVVAGCAVLAALVGGDARQLWLYPAAAATREADLESRRWRWQLDDTPAIDLQRVLLRPSTLALSGRMTIRYVPAGKSADAKDGWKSIGDEYITENPANVLNPDSDGYGMTYQFGDGWITLADTKQGLLLIERPGS